MAYVNVGYITEDTTFITHSLGGIFIMKFLIDKCNEMICFYSDNDPYISKKKAELFANIVKGKSVLVYDVGHFNEKYGYKEFKEIIEYIN